MAKRYFTLLAKEPHKKWQPQFGDYDRECVEDELADYRDHVGDGDTWPKGTKFSIIGTNDDQASIDACVAKLNISFKE
ncbi:MAG TPA: hypothetical protein VKB76_17455 [Ktedonobacterales bacterium]|nr:hypothetical protein [Ktedonobacterales bacterium]